MVRTASLIPIHNLWDCNQIPSGTYLYCFWWKHKYIQYYILVDIIYKTVIQYQVEHICIAFDENINIYSLIYISRHNLLYKTVIKYQVEHTVFCIAFDENINMYSIIY